MYTKPPQKAAFHNLQIYNVELPKFRKQNHDLTNPLDAWLYILDTSNQQNISVEEVIAMNETLRNTVNIDPGLTQFVRSYDVATADDDLRKEYNSYTQGLLYFTGIRRSAYEEGIEEGREEEKIFTARNLLEMVLTTEQIVRATNLSADRIESLSGGI
jgi:predicted transposase/invertase (TIGR01784 family)